MHNEIIDTRYTLASDIVDALDEAMTDRNLIFNATSLRNVGFGSLLEITEAVERAMAICNCNGLPVKEHFKSIYISDCALHTLQRDWKLSKLAYTLTILNGACDNPAVARLQFTMLQKYLKEQSHHDKAKPRYDADYA